MARGLQAIRRSGSTLAFTHVRAGATVAPLCLRAWTKAAPAKPFEAELEAYRALRAHELMLNQATSAFEHAAIAPLLVINGGGAVAFLTLLGAVAGDKDMSGSVHIATGWAVAATAAWAVGLVTAACAASLGYRAQRGFSKAHRIRRDAAEQRLLEKSNLAEVLRSDDYDQHRWAQNVARETKTAQNAQSWYSRARWASIACFVAGVACAALAVI